MALTLDGDNGVSGVNGSAGTPAIQGTDTNTGISFGTDTVNLVTGGSNRFVVGSAGQFGIGGATYGTSGQVLTSQGSGSAPQWATPSGVGWTIGTQTSATGSTVTWTSIPSTAELIEVILYQVSWNTNGDMAFRLGDFGGVENTGYFSTNAQFYNAVSQGSSTTDFRLVYWAATDHGVSGILRLAKRGTTGQNWIASGLFNTTKNDNTMMIAGSKDLSASLDRVQMLSTAGSFDAGSVQLNYWEP